MAASKKLNGLGRGFGSLIPEDIDVSMLVDDGERIEQISVDKLQPNPDQPRTTFDKRAIEELASSIKEFGVLQPLVVTPIASGYAIIAGERRWRASKLAGLKTVPAIVRTSKKLESLEIALVENVQRVDLSSLEQAVSVERLHQQFNMSYAQIAKRLGKAVSTISNIVRLIHLPAEAKEALESGKISEGHARQILALKDDVKKQQELLNLIIKHDWSVRQAERFVSSVKDGIGETKEAEKRVYTDTPETKRLTTRYSAPVQIRRTAKGGRVEISFKSDEDLARILAELER